MNTKKIISFTSFAAVSIALVTGINFTTKKGNYTPRFISTEKSNSSFVDANAYRNLLKQDAITGKVEFGKISAESQRIQKIKETNPFYRAGGLEWSEEGPFNRGGRTRAISIDPNNSSIMYSGGVSGGLFKSTDSGNTWSKITSLTDGNAVSSIEVLSNGYIYVATGCTFEGGERGVSNGNTHSYGSGLFVSKDKGVSWSVISGTEPTSLASGDWSQINKIVKSDDESKIYVAGDLTGTNSLAIIDVNSDAISYPTGLSGSVGWDVILNADGSAIYTVDNSRNIFKSLDGLNFASVYSIEAPLAAGWVVSRVVLAAAPSNKDYIYAVDVISQASFTVTGQMQSLLISKDGGSNWIKEVYNFPAIKNPTVSASGDYSQGQYDLCLTVNPLDENVVFVGGIRLFKYDSGIWDEVASITEGAYNYVHADIHTFAWSNKAVLWIGTDGGLFRSTNNGVSYDNYSRNFNTTQFYRIDIGLNDKIIGGTQDNGTQMFRRLEYGYNDTYEETGGDGGSADISVFNENYRVASSQFNSVLRRTFDNLDYEPLSFEGVEQGPFVSQLSVGEIFENTNSQDSVIFTMADADTILPLDTIFYESISVTGVSQFYVMPIGDSLITNRNNLGEYVRKDTIILQDKPQSILAIGGYGSIYLTRDIYNYSKTTDPVVNGIPTEQNMSWFKIDYLNSQGVNYLEFSDDNNTLFVGETNGNLYKITGLDSLYAKNCTGPFNPLLNQYNVKNENFITVKLVASFPTIITSIAIDHNDDDRVLVTYGGTANDHISEITGIKTGDATDAFVVNSLKYNLSDNLPVYSSVIDVNSGDIYIGTEFGLWFLADGSTSWQYEATFEKVPVYDIKQNYWTWEQGSRKNGTIYLGTHGRGLFKTESTLSNGGDNSINLIELKNEMKIYPNPVLTNTTIEINSIQNNEALYSIYSIEGKLMYNEAVNLRKGINSISYDASNLNRGMYIVRITFKDGDFITSHLTKK